MGDQPRRGRVLHLPAGAGIRAPVEPADPPRELHRLDYGGRYFYAPQSFADESGRRIMFGWLQEGRTEAATVEAGWSGGMSLPRIATMDANGELAFAPVPEMESLRVSADGGVRLHQLDAWRMEGIFDTPRHLFPG